jgi:hypothetical protein
MFVAINIRRSAAGRQIIRGKLDTLRTLDFQMWPGAPSVHPKTSQVRVKDCEGIQWEELLARCPAFMEKEFWKPQKAGSKGATNADIYGCTSFA